MSNFVKQLDITQLISKKKLKELIKKWDVDKGITKLPTSKMLNILIWSFIFKKNTLRDIEDCFSISRSTLNDALQKRSYGFFQDVFNSSLQALIPLIKNRKDRQDIKELIAIDASICLIHGSVAKQKIETKIEPKVAGIKYHAAWNVTYGYIEEQIITAYRKHDGTVGKNFQFLRGKTYVFDRAYVDLKLWTHIDSQGAYFVTRLKKGGQRLNYIHKGYVENNKVGVLLDTTWYPSETSCYVSGMKPKKLFYRQIVYRDPESKKLFDFITSDWQSPAEEVADNYRKRWAVELLFRWMKGHLNIRHLAFKNLNAIKIIMTMASLVQILIKSQALKSQKQMSDWDMLRSLRNMNDRFIYQILTNKGSPNRKLAKGPAELTFVELKI